MNIYVLKDILENLSQFNLIEYEVIGLKKQFKTTNKKILNLKRIMKTLLSQQRKDLNSMSNKITVLSNKVRQDIKENKVKCNNIMSELKKLRTNTAPYHKKIKIRNLATQIPDPDDIKGAYIDRPTQIETLQNEYDVIIKKQDKLKKLDGYYRVLIDELIIESYDELE